MIDYLITASYFSRFRSAFKQQLLEKLKIGDIGAQIKEAINPGILGQWQFSSFQITISDVVVVTWVVMIFVFVLAYLIGKQNDLVPRRMGQVISEGFINLLLNLCRDAGLSIEQSEKIIPFVGTIGIFITFTNLASLFNVPPPAKNPAFPITLALITILYVIVKSINFVGIGGFWSSLVYPKAMLLPFRLLDFVIKPLSLSLRLFGNVFGAYILMEFIYVIVPVLVPGIIGLWFDLADGVLQGAIFTYLTIMYIGEIIEGANEAAHERRHSPA